MSSITQADADAIASRVNCFKLGPWLLALLAQLGAQPPGALAALRTRVPLPLLQAGLTLQLYRRDGPGGPGWADAVVLERATFDSARAALPVGLDSAAETPASACAKLSANTAGSRGRVSYFLDDARVVELTFQPGDVGLREVLVVRLGAEQDFTRLSGLVGPARAHP